MSHPRIQPLVRQQTPRQPVIRWWPLIAVTTANYLWQVPYAVHQYRHRWDAMAGLSIPLIVTGVWFGVAAVATVGGWRGGRPAMAAFLVTETVFYVVHNASGAFAADLPLSNPVVLVASVVGYASTATAVVYLILMTRGRRAARTAPTRSQVEGSVR